MAPTIAVRIAPATPPPATWPMMLPISGVDALLASSGISIPRICPPGAAADRTRDGVSKGSEIDILGHAGGDIAAYGATDNLDNQIDEQSRHDALLPDPRVNFRDICTAPDHRRAIQLKRLKVQGHAAWCVQRRLACSAGDKPAGVEVRAP